MYRTFFTSHFVATKQEGELRAYDFFPNCLGNYEFNMRETDMIGAMSAFAVSTALAGIFAKTNALVSDKGCCSAWSGHRRSAESSESVSRLRPIAESC